MGDFWDNRIAEDLSCAGWGVTLGTAAASGLVRLQI